MRSFLTVISAICLTFCFSQPEIGNNTRVLFVLDGSGSMNGQWQSRSKFDIAKETLIQLVDSIYSERKDVDIAIRVFGHQYPRSVENCEDSELIVAFGVNDMETYRSALEEVEPKGQTPIAWSLLEATKDFNEDINYLNSIILITDGLETCEGDPCAASALLQQKRISINPYIIGLDIGPEEASNFDCVGTFVNATDKTSFKELVATTIEKVTQTTTLEINLNSSRGARITNTAITLFDSLSGDHLYNYIHAIQRNASPDTLEIDPRGVYGIKVHTNPPIIFNGLHFKNGEHNVADIPVRKSFVEFDHEKLYDEHELRFVVREASSNNILGTWFLRNEQFLTDSYIIDLTTLPMLKDPQVKLELEKTKEYSIEQNGTLSLEIGTKKIAGIYQEINNYHKLVQDLGEVSKDLQIKLQPGLYYLSYIEADSHDSESTSNLLFEIDPGRKTVLNLP